MALNQQPPFINPLVPFSCMVKGGLHDGMIITVCGRVWPNADRFNVNLQHGADDVVLHVNPRYQTYLLGVGSVVHNTLQKGTWGSVERKFENPFPKGEMFSLQILVTKDSYKILANGKLFSEYKHRVPFLDVDRICVVGMVELSLVTFHYLGPHHAAFPGTLTVPYKSIICGGVPPGKCIIIQGNISKQGKRVEFSLRHKTGIAFDCSLCFDEKVVVCKSFEDGQWGNEEKYGLKLFETGKSFQVTICSSPDDYEVFFNGEKAHTYSHRFTKLEEIDVLEVSGDVQLSFVQP